jgi:hypothetical protein
LPRSLLVNNSWFTLHTVWLCFDDESTTNTWQTQTPVNDSLTNQLNLYCIILTSNVLRLLVIADVALSPQILVILFTVTAVKASYLTQY